MTAIDKYNNAFIESFELSVDELSVLNYLGTELWDSVGHMTLISALEDTFDIMMETDDIIDLSSYENGIEILKSKYNVEF